MAVTIIVRYETADATRQPQALCCQNRPPNVTTERQPLSKEDAKSRMLSKADNTKILLSKPAVLVPCYHYLSAAKLCAAIKRRWHRVVTTESNRRDVAPTENLSRYLSVRRGEGGDFARF